jgi:hypothetical protein
LADHLFEVIFMSSQYPDLISLISENKEAMSYFKSLPDDIKCELSKNAGKIGTIENLKQYAAELNKDD